MTSRDSTTPYNDGSYSLHQEKQDDGEAAAGKAIAGGLFQETEESSVKPSGPAIPADVK